MSQKPARDVAVSVHQRLINLAHAHGRDPNQVRLHYVMERFLCRLSCSRHADHFILKGGLFLCVLGTPSSRPTLDIDLLGWHVENTQEHIEDIFRELAVVPALVDDGVSFLPESVETSLISKGAGYNGVRVEFLARLGKIPVKLKVDIGFGDVLHPEPERHRVGSFLADMPGAEIVCYPKESLIAEKFQAMVSLGMLNTRMKDFYDIRFLSQHLEFDASVLRGSIEKTFANRRTDLIDSLSLFTKDFASYKQAHWVSFVRRIRLEGLTKNFLEVMQDLESFLLPVVNGQATGCSWKPLLGWGLWE